MPTYYGNTLPIGDRSPSSMPSCESEKDGDDFGLGLGIEELHCTTPTQNYRQTTVGRLLMETLNELLKKKKITGTMCAKIASQFDRTILHVFDKIPRIGLAFKAEKLNTYRNMEGTWTFVLNNVEFRERNALANVRKTKMIVFNGRGPGRKEDKKLWDGLMEKSNK